MADFDHQTSDSYNEDDYDSSQVHAHRLYFYIKRFYKRDD